MPPNGKWLESFIDDLRGKLQVDGVLPPFLFVVLVQNARSILGISIAAVADEALPRLCEATASLENRSIEFRKSLFEEGLRGSVRALMTLVHEIIHIEAGHAGVNPRDNRAIVDIVSKDHRLFEWVAKRGAPLFLMPEDVTLECATWQELRDRCNVSEEAAKIRFNQVHRPKLSYLIKDNSPVGHTKKGHPVWRTAHDRFRANGAKVVSHAGLNSAVKSVLRQHFWDSSKLIDGYLNSHPENPLHSVSLNISAASLSSYASEIELKHCFSLARVEIPSNLFDEMTHFGLVDMRQVRSSTSGQMLQFYSEGKISDTLVGFVRNIMMYSDIIKYLAGPFRWRFIDIDDFNLLAGRYGTDSLNDTLEFSEIVVLDP